MRERLQSITSYLFGTFSTEISPSAEGDQGFPIALDLRLHT